MNDLISRLSIIPDLETRLKFHNELLCPDLTGLKYFAIRLDDTDYIVLDYTLAFNKYGKVYEN